MIEDILSRFHRVKSVGHNKYIACCPAHDDHDPSLSIKFTDYGKTLIFCHAGCSVYDVLSAVGLDMGDLMGDNPTHHRLRPVAHQDRPDHIQLQRNIDMDSYYRTVIDIARANAMKDIHLSPRDAALVKQAESYNKLRNPGSLNEYEDKRQRGERLTAAEKKLERKLWLRTHRSGRM